MITASLFLDCKYLLSEDLQHDQKINNLTIINPFLVDLEELTE
jgi:predicted nucleic acid-binding protein